MVNIITFLLLKKGEWIDLVILNIPEENRF